MSIILLPTRCQVPPMRLDSDDYHWQLWTRQPGGDGMMHVEVTGPSNAPAPRSRAALDQLGPLPVAGPQGDAFGGRLVLREYQRECVQAVDGAWQKGTKAPLVVLPTGAGKTVIASAIMDGGFVGRGHRSVFCAHRRELLAQTMEKIRLTSASTLSVPRVGLVQGKDDQLHSDITVASIQTLGGSRSSQRLNRFVEAGPYHILIVDEAHHAVSPQYLRVINALREAYPDLYILGMTATPGRADGTALDTVFDEVVFERNLLDMIASGYLVPPKGFKVDLGLNLDQVKSSGGDYVAKQLSKLMNQPQVNRAVVEAWRGYGHNRKTVVFCVDVAHAQALCEEFRDAGYSADYIYGAMKDRTRDATLKRFREGETKILLNCEIATEGFDEPSIECVLFARPTQSQPLYIQCLDAQTEVLTQRGWMGPDSVTDSDTAAQYNPATTEITWSPIRSIVDRPLAPNEDMWGIESPALSVRVTGGHRMLTRGRKSAFRFRRASELPHQYETILPVAGHETSCGNILLEHDELQLLGWWYADGSYNRTTRQLTFSCAVDSPYRERLEQLLTHCGLKWGCSTPVRRALFEKADGTSYEYEKPIAHYYVSHGALRGRGRHLRGWSHLSPWVTPDKSLAPAFEQLSADQLRAFLSGVWIGDGTKFATVTDWTVRTMTLNMGDNRTLTDQLQSLCLRRGMRCNVSGTKSALRLLVRPGKTDHFLSRANDGRPVWTRLRTEPGERVWCIETDLGTIITRRNGKVAIMGNCLGRGLRLYPAKTECIVIDCVGNSDKHRPVQLASLAGFDPERRDGGNGGQGDGVDDDDVPIIPTVISADPQGSEVDLTGHRASAKYPWVETKLGWVLNIPRIGYYLVAWATNAHTRCTIRFYDQRPGRRQSLPLDVVAQPIDFQLAYGLVEAEMDRIFNARAGRSMMRREDGSVYEDPRADRREFREFRNREEEPLPEINFVDLDEGVDDQLDISEDLMQRGAQWRTYKSTAKQKDLLRKLGVKEKSLPELAGEASDLITILRLEKDAKMRMPMTPKQIAYLKVNELPFPDPPTKGAAATIIWKHRKATGY